ncbi:putative ORFan [Tupanvirus deep ocean]|uniref:ORFan n=2 Tax=Tupanvirus TaxID=2094720 RepID=A0AC62A9K3_9VIRU|nr:putative ORFan [Tupanvirus deep ocean]QKU34450.1 putative ORFan [Tupanvirus deep ocean]
MDTLYKQKYLKYKAKYLKLLAQQESLNPFQENNHLKYNYSNNSNQFDLTGGVGRTTAVITSSADPANIAEIVIRNDKSYIYSVNNIVEKQGVLNNTQANNIQNLSGYAQTLKNSSKEPVVGLTIDGKVIDLRKLPKDIRSAILDNINKIIK